MSSPKKITSNRYAWDQLEVYRGWILRDAITPEELRKRYWQEQQSIPEISKISKVNKHVLYELMRKHQIPRRNSTESSFLFSKTTKPQFSAKESLSAEEEKLKIAGIMLYWGEGARLGPTVDFSNSNPEIIRLFLKFLRVICGVSESRLRAYLYHHGSTKKVEASKRFWHQVTQIPLSQFSRPYIRKGNPHRSGRVMPNGLIHIRYSDKRLLQLIQRWISEYSSATIGAGTKVANWASL